MSCYEEGAQKPTQRQDSARFAPDVPNNASDPVSQDRPPCLPIIQAQCISDLQKSHVALSTQLSQLQDKFATLVQRMSSEAHRHRHQGDEASVLKVLAFTTIRAAATLCKGSLELGKRPDSLSPLNSVMQIDLTSTPTDCTLGEFRLLALSIRRRPSIRRFFLSFRIFCCVSECLRD